MHLLPCPCMLYNILRQFPHEYTGFLIPNQNYGGGEVEEEEENVLHILNYHCSLIKWNSCQYKFKTTSVT